MELVTNGVDTLTQVFEPLLSGAHLCSGYWTPGLPHCIGKFPTLTWYDFGHIAYIHALAASKNDSLTRIQMKIIQNENFDHKKMVIDGYNKCSTNYAKVRNNENESSLKLLTDKLIRNDAKVLDLGCGNGIPVSKILSKYKLTGIDISEKQIEQAKSNIPNAEFICTDILEFDFKDNYWNAIVSYYTIFHLKKDEQLMLFDKMAKGLSLGGYFLLTLTLLNEQGYIEDDFFGVEMFWENYSLKEYESILAKKGMEILYSGMLKHGYNEKYNGEGETHPILFGFKASD